jgi:hypothetical protein
VKHLTVAANLEYDYVLESLKIESNFGFFSKLATLYATALRMPWMQAKSKSLERRMWKKLIKR